MLSVKHVLPFLGSPIWFDVEDATQVVARGRCLEASPVNQRVEFEIDPSKAPFRADAYVKILCKLQLETIM